MADYLRFLFGAKIAHFGYVCFGTCINARRFGCIEERMSKRKQTHKQLGEAPKMLAQATRKLAPDDWRRQPLSGLFVVGLLEEFIVRYVVLPQGMPFVLTLWIIGTHLFEVFDAFPYLCVTSPVKRSGKTRLAEILELLCPRALNSVNITEAALFRTVDEPETRSDYGRSRKSHESTV